MVGTAETSKWETKYPGFRALTAQQIAMPSIQSRLVECHRANRGLLVMQPNKTSPRNLGLRIGNPEYALRVISRPQAYREGLFVATYSIFAEPAPTWDERPPTDNDWKVGRA